MNMNHFHFKNVRDEWDGRWGDSRNAPCLREEYNWVRASRDENKNDNVKNVNQNSFANISLSELIRILLVILLLMLWKNT